MCAASGDCAAGLACLFQRCRPACQADSECQGDSLCFSDGTTSGCRLPNEQSCGDGGACGDPLIACGLDGTCRVACSANKSCPRSDQTCIAGTCVSTTETGYASTWGACTATEQGEYGCDGGTLFACDVKKPGKVVIGACATPELCKQGAAEKASACPVCGSGGVNARCEGTSADACNATHSGFDTTDCASGPAKQCNPSTGQCVTIDIDAHEVTRDEYAAFFASNPAAGTGACAYKTGTPSYAPDASCMSSATVCKDACGDHPQTCVDWWRRGRVLRSDGARALRAHRRRDGRQRSLR